MILLHLNGQYWVCLRDVEMEGKRSSEQEESLKCNIYRMKC